MVLPLEDADSATTAAHVLQHLSVFQLRDIFVIKRGSGDRQVFNRDKLHRSITIALQKRPVSPEKVEQIVSSIVRRIETLGETEVPSSAIGEQVMISLQQTDFVAYVRFASVYKNFQEANDFTDFVKDASSDLTPPKSKN